MWLPNALPLDRLKSFAFSPSQSWIENLQLASVHIGASGSFVSPDGLILTNHHVALRGLHNISTPTHNYVADGFFAKSRADEVKLPGQEVSVLLSIEDVTARVNAAVPATLSPEAAVKARHAVFAAIERESLEKAGNHSTVVTLYGGALYHLYRYNRYTDIRLVFAPEFQAAFFGGDLDNFEYPRYCLDIAFMRAYENNQPAHIEHFLKLAPQGVADNELVFVSGHPFRTDRFLTADMLRTMRDTTLRFRLNALKRAEKALLDYSAQNDESKREAADDLFGVQNSRKALAPRLAALQSGLVDEEQKRQDQFRAALRAHPNLKQTDQAYDTIAAAEKSRRQLEARRDLLEADWALNSQLFRYARTIIRIVAENQLPDPDRLPEYTASKRDELEHELFAGTPIYPNLEIAKLTDSLQLLLDTLGPTDPTVQKILANQSPAQRAAQLVHNTKLGAPSERLLLAHATPAQLQSSTDPMIQLALAIDPEARSLRKQFESQVTEPETRALADINRARFALNGPNEYPDATGTLRFSFGIVKGYQQNTQLLPPWTTFAGAFQHERSHDSTYPYVLPESWHEAFSFNPSTPLDFVSTLDTTGGNSGSPIVNRAGQQVGILFDSNHQGVANSLLYTDEQARSIAVDSRAILESLQHIYHATSLLNELTHPNDPHLSFSHLCLAQHNCAHDNACVRLAYKAIADLSKQNPSQTRNPIAPPHSRGRFHHGDKETRDVPTPQPPRPSPMHRDPHNLHLRQRRHPLRLPQLGLDTNPGSLAQPFASLVKAQAAASSGDTIFLRGGTYSNFSPVATDATYQYGLNFNKSNISYSAYPGDPRPVLNFSALIPDTHSASAPSKSPAPTTPSKASTSPASTPAPSNKPTTGASPAAATPSTKSPPTTIKATAFISSHMRQTT